MSKWKFFVFCLLFLLVGTGLLFSQTNNVAGEYWATVNSGGRTITLLLILRPNLDYELWNDVNNQVFYGYYSISGTRIIFKNSDGEDYGTIIGNRITLDGITYIKR